MDTLTDKFVGVVLLARDIVLGALGLAAIVLALLWLGVPSPVVIDWNTPVAHDIGSALILIGIAGLGIPYLFISGDSRLRRCGGLQRLVRLSAAVGILIAFGMFFLLDSPVAAWKNPFLALFTAGAIAGGLCLLWCAAGRPASSWLGRRTLWG